MYLTLLAHVEQPTRDREASRVGELARPVARATDGAEPLDGMRRRHHLDAVVVRVRDEELAVVRDDVVQRREDRLPRAVREDLVPVGEATLRNHVS